MHFYLSAMNPLKIGRMGCLSVVKLVFGCPELLPRRVDAVDGGEVVYGRKIG
jgi:hypothetical protein